jgi:hypothetical protein
MVSRLGRQQRTAMANNTLSQKYVVVDGRDLTWQIEGMMIAKL